MVVVMVIFSLTIIILGFLAVRCGKHREKELSEEWKNKLLRLEHLYIMAMLALFLLMVVVGYIRVLDAGGNLLTISLIFGILMFAIVGTIVGLAKQLIKLSKFVDDKEDRIED